MEIWRYWRWPPVRGICCTGSCTASQLQENLLTHVHRTCLDLTWTISSCAPHIIKWGHLMRSRMQRHFDISDRWQIVDPQSQPQILQECKEIPKLLCLLWQAVLSLTALNMLCKWIQRFLKRKLFRHLRAEKNETYKQSFCSFLMHICIYRLKQTWVSGLTECDKDNTGTISEQSADEWIGIHYKWAAICQIGIFLDILDMSTSIIECTEQFPKVKGLGDHSRWWNWSSQQIWI